MTLANMRPLHLLTNHNASLNPVEMHSNNSSVVRCPLQTNDVDKADRARGYFIEHSVWGRGRKRIQIRNGRPLSLSPPLSSLFHPTAPRVVKTLTVISCCDLPRSYPRMAWQWSLPPGLETVKALKIFYGRVGVDLNEVCNRSTQNS